MVCTRIQDIGGPCASFDGDCVKGAYCDSTMNKCVARLRLAKLRQFEVR
jgi:hypothetical protein